MSKEKRFWATFRLWEGDRDNRVKIMSIDERPLDEVLASMQEALKKVR